MSGWLNDRYRVEERLFEKQDRTLYRAHDRRLEQTVLLWVQWLDQSDAADELREHCLMEARVLMKMEHPHILTVLNYFEEENACYIVFEDVKYQTLSDVLSRQERLSIQRVRPIALQLMDTLDYIHKQGYIYMNVSLQEILIDDDDAILLYDFSSLCEKNHRIDRMITHAGHNLPSEAYQPNAAARADSDVYGVGAALYEMLSGRSLLAAPRRERISEKYHKEILEKLQHFDDQISSGEDASIRRSLSLKRRERFQSMGEFRSAFLEEQAMQPEKQWVNRHQRRAYWLIFLNVLVILALLVVLAQQQKSRFHKSVIQADTISVLLPYQNEQERQANEQIVNYYQEEYPQIDVSLTQVAREDYAAFVTQEPSFDVFFWNEAIDLQTCADLHDLMKMIDPSCFYGFDQGTFAKRLPLGFEAEIRYQNAQPDADAQRETTDAETFYQGQAQSYLGSSAQLGEVITRLPGLWRIEADETVKITYRDQVCVRKSTTNKESAAMLFVYVLLGDYAQNEHYLQQDSWLPVNRETLSRYIEGYPQLSYLEEAALVIKEE